MFSARRRVPSAPSVIVSGDGFFCWVVSRSITDSAVEGPGALVRGGDERPQAYRSGPDHECRRGQFRSTAVRDAVAVDRARRA